VTADERVRWRFRYLKALYDRVGDNTALAQHYQWMASDIGLDHESAGKFAQYFHSQGLVALTQDGNLRITHAGVTEIEAALTKPQLPTLHFPAYVINVQNMTNSSIQQGTHQSSVSISVSEGDLKSIKELIGRIEASINQLQLPSTATQEMKAEIDTLNSQISSPKPKKVIIMESLRSIRAILEGVTGSLIATGLATEIAMHIS